MRGRMGMYAWELGVYTLTNGIGCMGEWGACMRGRMGIFAWTNMCTTTGSQHGRVGHQQHQKEEAGRGGDVGHNASDRDHGIGQDAFWAGRWVVRLWFR